MSKIEVQLLKKARRIVEAKGEFICIALSDVAQYEGTQVAWFASGSLRLWIQSMLDGWSTLDGWLQGLPEVRDFFEGSEEYDRRAKATRLAWIDWMIVQCGGKP